MTSSKRARLLASLGILAALCAAPAASAQKSAQDLASARQLYNDGIELRDKGDLKGALGKFKAAHALGNTPLTGIELCRIHSALKQPVEAREVCLAVGRIAPTSEETQRSKDARAEASRIGEAELSKIGALRVKVVGVPAGFQPVVTVDGAVVPAAALNEPRSVDPGAHVITGKVGSAPETRTTVETKEGETKDVELAVQPPPEGEKPGAVVVTGPNPPGEKGDKGEKKSSLPIVLFGLGGAAVALGAIGGIIAISGEGDLDKACAEKICGRDQWDKLSSARTWGTVSTVSFVVAGVALGAGLIATLTAPSSRSGSARPPAKTKTSSLRVRFVVGGLDGSF